MHDVEQLIQAMQQQPPVSLSRQPVAPLCRVSRLPPQTTQIVAELLAQMQPLSGTSGDWTLPHWEQVHD